MKTSNAVTPPLVWFFGFLLLAVSGCVTSQPKPDGIKLRIAVLDFANNGGNHRQGLSDFFADRMTHELYRQEKFDADSGLIALLVCLELFSEEAKPVSELVASLDPYFRTGEINTPVDDIPRKLLELEHAYATGRIDKLDGITIDYGAWWFNVRPSNTEPLLRLNLEAKTKSLMGEKRDEVLKLIRGHA